jgi:protein-tyrosine kinase
MEVSLEKAVEKARKESRPGNSNQSAPKVRAPVKTSSDGPDYRDVQCVTLDKDAIADNRCVCVNPDALEGEFYKVLRTQVQQVAAEKGWRTIMVTSTLPDEGKTLTCINLAFSFAKAYDQTVLLVDADLKKQQVHKTLNIQSQYGLIDYLINDQPIKDCLLWPEGEKLVLISGGKTVGASSELLGSQMMKAFVREARDRYEDRLVVFDVPPIMVGADAIAFAPLVDGIVFVIRAGQTSTKQARSALELLPPDKLIGVVLNGQKINTKPYRAYYGQQEKGGKGLNLGAPD